MGLAAAAFHQGAYVVQSGHLLAWVLGLPAVLTDQEVTRVAGLVAQSFPVKQRNLGTVFYSTGGSVRTRPVRTRARSHRRLVSRTDKVRLAAVATFFAVYLGGGQALFTGGFEWFGQQVAHAVVPKVVPSPVVTPVVRAPLLGTPKS